ncbi:MAG: NPCBM/NEW2 domain-containing protein [Pirellulales bacterium]
MVEGKLRLETPAGAELDLPLERVNSMVYPARYLTDFPAEQVVFETRVREPRAVADLVAKRYGPRFDKALEPGPLRLGGRDYHKGVALHSRSTVTWLLAEPFVKFTATVGIDDRVRPHGNAKLTIYGDDRVLFERNVQGSDAPAPIALDLTGVTRLKVTVDFGDDGIETGDYLDLCDARLYK